MNWEKYKRTWPNAAHSTFVRVSPHHWHVQSKGAGKTVLMLHGAGASTHTWAPIFTALSQTHHVIAIDLPGQGFTKLGDRNRCGLDHMTKDISALLDHLAIVPDIIFGHSAGAAIALNLATIMDPQPNVLSINGAFENFDGLPGILFPMLAKLLSLNPATGYVFSRFSGNRNRVKKLIESTGSHLSADQIHHYECLVSDADHVNSTLLMMAQWSLNDLPKRLTKIQSQVLFLTGSLDKAVPPAASCRASKFIQNSKVEKIVGLGHLIHEEDPGAIIGRLGCLSTP